MKDILFKKHRLDEIVITIKGVRYNIEVVVYEHGIRFTTSLKKKLLLDGDEIELGTRRFHFGEGYWLNLPDIEDAVLEYFDGDQEDVLRLTQLYDDLIAVSLPILITGNNFKGFIKEEHERLQESNDLSNPV